MEDYLVLLAIVSVLGFVVGALFVEFIAHDSVGLYQAPNWRRPLPMYSFHCPEHGRVISHLDPHSGNLNCPVCEGNARDKS